jgi:ABC-type enterochelin transport system substrate-binding protein
MKKYTIVFALIAVTVLSACGNGSTTTEKTDSTSVKVDSASVDSTVVETSTDTSEVKEVK